MYMVSMSLQWRKEKFVFRKDIDFKHELLNKKIFFLGGGYFPFLPNYVKTSLD